MRLPRHIRSGQGFVAKADAATTVRTETTPADSTGIVARHVAEEPHRAGLPGRERPRHCTRCTSAHLTVAMRHPARRPNGFEANGSAEARSGDQRWHSHLRHLVQSDGVHISPPHGPSRQRLVATQEWHRDDLSPTSPSRLWLASDEVACCVVAHNATSGGRMPICDPQGELRWNAGSDPDMGTVPSD